MATAPSVTGIWMIGPPVLRACCAAVRGVSVAPKSTVWASNWLMPAPLPTDW